nr:MAG TPA: hypothetical protein [Inoviridae sp.]
MSSCEAFILIFFTSYICLPFGHKTLYPNLPLEQDEGEPILLAPIQASV